MFGSILRRLAMAAIVGFIVGGLWVLARWKAELDNPAPSLFSNPLYQPIVTPGSIPSLSTGDGPSLDEILLEDDQIIRVG
jgi:hypothetical protein